ncbi:MAG: transcriptional regulator NrdR [Candidatus Omnitrophota bacterium]
MKCPFCGNLEDKVVDSRSSQVGDAIRRRRECLKCLRRFTTYENIEETSLMVVKKDGRRERYDRHKILNGLIKACEKRPISMDVLEKTVDEIEQNLQINFEREVKTKEIGELVMEKLHNLDAVAYVRFASVYREFRDLNQFLSELKVCAEKACP